MGKRAALVSIFLGVAILSWLWSSRAPPRFFMLASPPMRTLPAAPLARLGSPIQPRLPVPHMMATTKADAWDYDTPLTQEDVQRRIIERLFRKELPSPRITDVADDKALQAVAQEVRDIAATFGEKEAAFADKWVAKVMAT